MIFLCDILFVLLFNFIKCYRIFVLFPDNSDPEYVASLISDYNVQQFTSGSM